MGVVAVVVTYHPAAELIENVVALLDQVDEVVIVDNGSGAAGKELLENLGVYPRVNIIYNQDNLGVATALNIAAKLGKAAGHQWVATFDQDSKVTPGMIKAMLQAYDTYPQKDKIAGLSPCYQNQSTGKIIMIGTGDSHTDGLLYAEVLVVMTSGNLIKTNVFDTVGYFNEALFIDHVDTEFCLRCARRDYKILKVKDAILLHRTGAPVKHRLLGKLRSTSNHSISRRYYMMRNGIYVYRRFAFAYPVWVVNDAYRFFKATIMMLLVEEDKWQKLAAIFKGLVHGLFGKMGKLNEPN